jgi:hypothetical protein
MDRGLQVQNLFVCVSVSGGEGKEVYCQMKEVISDAIKLVTEYKNLEIQKYRNMKLTDDLAFRKH